ncbi:MAG: J domain-containing protein [Cyanobacteria bacterium P01_F01_bin.150]
MKIAPWASPQDIRKAYRDLSKLYHPDTTALPADIATAKFQALNDAYAVLSNPEQRSQYDLRHGYSRFSVVQSTRDLNKPVSSSKVPGWSDQARIRSNSSYLDPNDRPLSPGEIFAVVLLGVTFVGCLGLVLLASLFRGESAVLTVGLFL